jgi:hypothetical protein
MRVGETRSHVESEFVIVINFLITELDSSGSTFSDNVLLEDGVKHGIDLVLNGFNQEWETFLEGKFEIISKSWVSKSGDAWIFHKEWLLSLDPRKGLALRINHEWVSGRSLNHDSVLDRQVIRRKTFVGPSTKDGVINEEVSDSEFLRYGHTSLHDIVVERLVQEFGSEFRVEWTTIRDEGTGLGDITD